MEVVGSRGKGRPVKTWQDCINAVWQGLVCVDVAGSSEVERLHCGETVQPVLTWRKGRKMFMYVCMYVVCCSMLPLQRQNLVKQLALQEWYQTCLKHQTVMGRDG